MFLIDDIGINRVSAFKEKNTTTNTDNKVNKFITVFAYSIPNSPIINLSIGVHFLLKIIPKYYLDIYLYPCD